MIKENLEINRNRPKSITKGSHLAPWVWSLKGLGSNSSSTVYNSWKMIPLCDSCSSKKKWNKYIKCLTSVLAHSNFSSSENYMVTKCVWNSGLAVLSSYRDRPQVPTFITDASRWIVEASVLMRKQCGYLVLSNTSLSAPSCSPLKRVRNRWVEFRFSVKRE